MARLSLALVAVLSLLVAGSSACWRGDARVEAPRPSFVARVNAVAELQRRVDAFEPRIEYIRQRLIGLASEAERDAIERDLARFDRELAALARYADASSERGGRSPALDLARHDIDRVARELEQLHEDVVYAKTAEQLEALEALTQQRDLDPVEAWGGTLVPPRVYRTDPLVEPVRVVGTPRVLIWTSGRRLQLVPPRRRAP